jgi:hypothetical protein
MISNSNIFFAPVSSGMLYSNFEKSVINGIDANKILNHFPKTIKVQTSPIRFWGIRDAKKSTFLKTKPGDVVFFYQEGNVIGFSKVVGTFINEDLASETWGVFKNKQRGEEYYWPNIIVFENYQPCLIPFSKFIEIAEYSPKFSIRGYIELNEIGTKRFHENEKEFQQLITKLVKLI